MIDHHSAANRAVGIIVAGVACIRGPQIGCHLLRMALMVVLVKVPSFIVFFFASFFFFNSAAAFIYYVFFSRFLYGSISWNINQNKIVQHRTDTAPLEFTFITVKYWCWFMVHLQTFQLTIGYNLISFLFPWWQIEIYLIRKNNQSAHKSSEQQPKKPFFLFTRNELTN